MSCLSGILDAESWRSDNASRRVLRTQGLLMVQAITNIELTDDILSQIGSNTCYFALGVILPFCEFRLLNNCTGHFSTNRQRQFSNHTVQKPSKDLNSSQ